MSERLLLLFGVFWLSQSSLSLSNFDEYLQNIPSHMPKYERTYEPGEAKFSEELIGKLSKIDLVNTDIVVLFDISNSTRVEITSSSFIGKMDFAKEIENAYQEALSNGPIGESEEAQLIAFLVKKFEINISRWCTLTEHDLVLAIKNLKEGKPADPARGASRPSKKTKHVALAMAEGTARLFNMLSKTNSIDAQLYLLGFGCGHVYPENLAFPHKISEASQFEEIAKKLTNILPDPFHNHTYLSPSLEVVINEVSKRPLKNMLLIIVTDGYTEDALISAKLLNDFSRKLAQAGKNLDIFAVGAGAISGESSTGKTGQSSQAGFASFSKRSSALCNNAQQSNGSCNMGYLLSLADFITLSGKGAYEGTYRDYSALEAAFLELLTRPRNIIYAQDSEGVMSVASELQISAAQEAVCSDEQGVVCAGGITVIKSDDTNSLTVVDESTKKQVRLVLAPPLERRKAPVKPPVAPLGVGL